MPERATLLHLLLLLALGSLPNTQMCAQTSVPTHIQTSIPTSPLALPGSGEALSLGPSSEQAFSVTIPAGEVQSLSAEQTEGSLQLRWQPLPGTPAETRTNRSGRLSLVTFHALGLTENSGSHAEVHGTLTVANPGKTPIAYRILIGPAHAAGTSDASMLSAEHDEAAALAAPHTTAGAQASLPRLQAAAARWGTSARPVEQTRAQAQAVYTQAFAANDGAGALDKLPALLALAGQVAAESPVEAANAFKIAAFVYAKQARYDDALANYNQALPLFEQTADLYNRVVVLENRAKIERLEAHYDLALKDVDAALPLTRQAADARGELALEVERGAIASASGQPGLAYEADLRAVSLARTTPNPFLEGVAWSDLAVACTELHDFPQAGRALDRAETIWKANPNPYGQLQTQEDRAELELAAGEYPAARASFAAGAAVAASQSLPREHAYFLHGLAVAAMHSGRVAEAKTHLDQAIAEAEHAQVNDALASLHSSRGDLLAAGAQWPEATAEWNAANTLATNAGDTLGRAIALGGLIRADLDSNHPDRAGEHCAEAMSALESIRGSISDADLRLSFFSSRHALYDLCVQAALRRHDSEAAFDVAERARARTLLDQAAAAGVVAELPKPMLERLQANERQLAAVRRQMVARPAPARSRHVTASLDDLLRQRDALRTEAGQDGIASRLAVDALPLREAEILGRLDPDTALVAWWLSPSGSVAWLITQRGASLSPLSSARTIEDASRRYLASLLAPLRQDGAAASAHDRAQVLANAQEASRRQGMALRRMLLPMPIPARIHRLLLVPDGVLQSISFSSLPSTGSGYLASRFELVTEPSAAFAWRPSRAASTELRSVIFADPARAAEPAAASVPATRADQSASLPFARREGQELRELLGTGNTRLFTGASATRATALALDWKQFDLAHFATHAVLRETHPELSGLLLAPPTAGADPSLLSFYDVLQMKAPLQLAVLDACSSGMGRLTPGEGKLALDNAFLAAGTSRVVATLWPVDDEAGSVFMHEFYRALLRTRSPAQSLQAAQLTMAASEDWHAPFYWGAFTLTGDWHPLTR